MGARVSTRKEATGEEMMQQRGSSCYMRMRQAQHGVVWCGVHTQDICSGAGGHRQADTLPAQYYQVKTTSLLVAGPCHTCLCRICKTPFPSTPLTIKVATCLRGLSRATATQPAVVHTGRCPPLQCQTTCKCQTCQILLGLQYER